MHISSFNNQGFLTIPSFSNSDDEPNISKSAFQNDLIKTSTDLQFEQLISNLLKYGVLIACSIVLVGGILYLIRYGAEPANYQFFQGQPSVLHCPKLVFKGILSGSHNSIIVFGLLLLIAIPVVRVALCLLTFVRQKDFTYTVMTLLALSGLIYSFAGTCY